MFTGRGGPSPVTRPARRLESVRVGQSDADLGDQFQDGRSHRDDVVAVGVVGVHVGQLQRQQFQFADQAAASFRGRAPPAPR